MTYHLQDPAFRVFADGAPRPVLKLAAKAQPAAYPGKVRRRRPWWTPAGWLLVVSMYALAFVLRRLAAVRKRPDWLDDY